MKEEELRKRCCELCEPEWMHDGHSHSDEWIMHQPHTCRNTSCFCHNPKTVGKYIEIGGFSLHYSRDPQREGNIWIEAPSGEGGDFQITLLEKALQEFFDKYF